MARVERGRDEVKVNRTRQRKRKQHAYFVLVLLTLTTNLITDLIGILGAIL